MDLSNRRANSVVAHLRTQYGIDATRLKSVGLGLLAPVASNERRWPLQEPPGRAGEAVGPPARKEEHAGRCIHLARPRRQSLPRFAEESAPIRFRCPSTSAVIEETDGVRVDRDTSDCVVAHPRRCSSTRPRRTRPVKTEHQAWLVERGTCSPHRAIQTRHCVHLDLSSRVLGGSRAKSLGQAGDRGSYGASWREGINAALKPEPAESGAGTSRGARSPCPRE
jgi:hypothetical protein